MAPLSLAEDSKATGIYSLVLTVPLAQHHGWRYNGRRSHVAMGRCAATAHVGFVLLRQRKGLSWKGDFFFAVICEINLNAAAGAAFIGFVAQWWGYMCVCVRS